MTLLGPGARRTSTMLGSLLLLGLLAPALATPATPLPAVEEVVALQERTGASGPHLIRKVVVDNTGDRVGVTVRHRGADWTGTVTMRFDVRGGPRPELVAVIRRGGSERKSFVRRDGTPWGCSDRTARSAPARAATRVVGARSCFDGAPKMRVTARVEVDPRNVDAAASTLVRQQLRPNVVLIMLDDMRYDELKYMPRTQKLIGDQGVRFQNSVAPYPLCCPARASVLTGRYVHNHRVFSHLPPYGFSSFDDRSTLATWLQDAGYQTTFIGKYLNGYGKQPTYGETSGRSTRYVPPGWSDWRASIDGGLPADHPKRGGTYRYMDTTLSDDGDGFSAYQGRYQTNVYGDLSQQVVTQRAASTDPFFFFVSYTAPHHGGPKDPDDPGPVTSDSGTREKFGTPMVPRRARGIFDDVIDEAPGAGWFDRAAPPRDRPRYLRRLVPMNREERVALREVARQRAEALSIADQEVAATMAALRRTGELDDTLVLFTSDNGYFLGEQGIRTGKTLPHDPALRTPLLVRGPGIPAGEVRYDPFLSIDFAPTIAEIAEVQPGGPVDGTSMLSVAREGDVGWTRAVLTATGSRATIRETDEAGQPLPAEDPGAADIRYAIGVRTDRYLYVHLANGDEELYDMAVDPDQYDNLVNDAGYAHVRDLLREQLQAVRACDEQQCLTPLPPGLASAPGDSIRVPG